MISFLARAASRISAVPRGAFAPRLPGTSVNTMDLAMYALIFMFGCFYFISYMKAADLTLDATYPELARSLVEHGRYEFDFLPETKFPPGFPVILALVCRWAGFSPAVLFHVVAVFATLGLLATYELLRRVEGRLLAGVVCVLFASAPALFSFVTELVFAEMPYFFFSTVVLLLAFKMDRSTPGAPQIGSTAVLTLCLIIAVTTRSVAVALVLAIGTWIIVSFWTKPDLAHRRMALFCVPLILGLGAQVMWTEWAGHRQTREWSVATWDQPYTAQLFMKDGDRPELGRATWRDIPERIGRNLYHRSAVFSEMLTRHGGTNFWPSPAIIGVIGLVIIGLGASLWKNGGQLHDWYFFWHEMTFLLWPWQSEGRFILPIFALACLYLWRGGKTLKEFAASRSGLAGASFFLIGAFLAFECAEFAAHASAKRWQPAVGALLWGIFAIVGLVLIWLRLFNGTRRVSWVLTSLSLARPRLTVIAQAVAFVALAAIVADGCDMQLQLARHNANPDLTQEPWYSDIEAAEWIRSHEPPGLVVMARKQDLVFHYTHHRVVFFPPSSDPEVLMEGIRKHHIALIVVVTRKAPLLEPAEDVCFKALADRYPDSFSLIHSGSGSSIYEVTATGSFTTTRRFGNRRVRNL
jgi:hypothetical protein